jgi:hypothetical protein
VASARRQTRSVLHRDDVLAARVRLDPRDAIDVDDRRPMHSNELCWIELQLAKWNGKWVIVNVRWELKPKPAP